MPKDPSAKKADRQIESVSGKVEREVVRRGTASEHGAAVLHAAGGERLILQRVGGNAFDDAVTRALVGHSVRVEGFRLGDVFRYTKAEQLD